MEEDDHAEMEAAFMFNRENLETVAQRLDAFEVSKWFLQIYKFDLGGAGVIRGTINYYRVTLNPHRNHDSFITSLFLALGNEI